MKNIQIIGSIDLDENKRKAIGWDEDTQKVYISEETGDIQWIDTQKLAKSEKEAKLSAKEYCVGL